MSAHRFEQVIDKIGETVTILKYTSGATDQFGDEPKTWETETTEKAILPSPTTKNFAELFQLMAGHLTERDRLAYFKTDSVVAKGKRVLLASGDEYEVDVLDTPRVFDTAMMKIVKLRQVEMQ
jgi:hypothetical protein